MGEPTVWLLKVRLVMARPKLTTYGPFVSGDVRSA
jgi:hypothetical protein